MGSKPSTTEFVEIGIPVKVLATAPLNMRVGRDRPEVKLIKMSDKTFAVLYSAWGSVHETHFSATDYDDALEFFNRITGQPTKPWQPRKVKPASKGAIAARTLILAAITFASVLAITSAARAFFPGQEACCGPSSMYNEENSSPLQFQEDNATGQACCGLGSQYEIDREWQEENQQQFMNQTSPQFCFGGQCE